MIRSKWKLQITRLSKYFPSDPSKHLHNFLRECDENGRREPHAITSYHEMDWLTFEHPTAYITNVLLFSIDAKLIFDCNQTGKFESK